MAEGFFDERLRLHEAFKFSFGQKRVPAIVGKHHAFCADKEHATFPLLVLGLGKEWLAGVFAAMIPSKSKWRPPRAVVNARWEFIADDEPRRSRFGVDRR